MGRRLLVGCVSLNGDEGEDEAVPEYMHPSTSEDSIAMDAVQKRRDCGCGEAAAAAAAGELG